MSDQIIRPISAAATRPLRHAILRPHQPVEALVYPGDEHPLAFHAGAFHGDELVGIASIAPNPCPRADFAGPWQLRGMATTPEVRGLGYGRALITACLAHVAAHQGLTLWCNGRTSAAGFYTTMGFAPIGEEFMADTGPHYVFWRAVAPQP
jgi:GNAT superfamily N-acetyltransferase